RVIALSTFYVLPPRPLLRQRVAGFLTSVFPGLDLNADHCADLAEFLGEAVTRTPDVFVIYREDLADGVDTQQALCDGFGGEQVDEVIELRVGPRPGEWTAQRWRVAS